MNLGSEPKDFRVCDKEAHQTRAPCGTAFPFGSAVETWLGHTANMLTLITAAGKETGTVTRGDEAEESGTEGRMKPHGGWWMDTTEREWSWSGRIVKRRRCGDGEQEEEEEQDSPEGSAVELVELWLDVGDEDVWLTGGAEELMAGILGGLGGNESGSLTSSSNGSGEGGKETF